MVVWSLQKKLTNLRKKKDSILPATQKCEISTCLEFSTLVSKCRFDDAQDTEDRVLTLMAWPSREGWS